MERSDLISVSKKYLIRISGVLVAAVAVAEVEVVEVESFVLAWSLVLMSKFVVVETIRGLIVIVASFVLGPGIFSCRFVVDSFYSKHRSK